MAEVVTAVANNTRDDRDTESEIIEVVAVQPDRDLHRVVQDALNKAKDTLACSRHRKIRLNLTSAANQHASLQLLHDPSHSLLRAAASALDALPKHISVPVCMEPVRRAPPNGRAWVRVQTNMLLPPAYSHSFHVPYLGESDAHLRSSNNLAMDLLQQEQANEGEESDIEDYVDSSLVQCDEDVEDGDTPIAFLRRNKSMQRVSLREKRDSSSHKVKRHLLKYAEAVWDRGAKRVALKAAMDKLRLTDVETITDAVCDVFGFWSPLFAVTYHRVVSNRLAAIAEADKDVRDRKDGLDLVKRQASGCVVDGPAEVMKSESVKVFICRQCYSYLCILHGQMNQPKPAVLPTDGTTKDSARVREMEAIEASCEDRKAKDCLHNGTDRNDAKRWLQSLQGQPEVWRDVEPVVLELFKSFGRDSCRISSLLRVSLPALHLSIKFTCRRVGHLIQEVFPEVYENANSIKRVSVLCKKKKSKWKSVRPPQEQESGNLGRRLDYEPCHHEGACTMQNCACRQKGVLCEKFCGCFSPNLQDGKLQGWCSHMHKGCTCKGSCQSKACVCFSMNRECDPDICKSCHECRDEPHIDKKWSCQNNGLRMKRRQRVVAGHSKVHGWGVFATDRIAKNEIIGEYVGEVISDDEAERRGRVYDEVTYSFLFTTTEQYVLDSTHLGNKLRYCNHSQTPNCEPRVMRVGGDVRVGLYAKRDIEENEELFFNYGYNESGPKWAMEDKPVKSKAKSCVSDKRRLDSDDDSNELTAEVLPISTRRGKAPDLESKLPKEPLTTGRISASLSEKEIGFAIDVEIGSPKPVASPPSKRKRREEVDLTGDDDVADNNQSKGKFRLEAQGAQSPNSSLRSSGSGRSVWRGILRRVSNVAADTESSRKLDSLVNGQNERAISEGKAALHLLPGMENVSNGGQNNGKTRNILENMAGASERVFPEDGSGSTVTERLMSLPIGTPVDDQMLFERHHSQLAGAGEKQRDERRNVHSLSGGNRNAAKRDPSEERNKPHGSCRKVRRVSGGSENESDTESDDPRSVPSRLGLNGSNIERSFYESVGPSKSTKESKKHHDEKGKSTGGSRHTVGGAQRSEENLLVRGTAIQRRVESYTKFIAQSPAQSYQNSRNQSKGPSRKAGTKADKDSLSLKPKSVVVEGDQHGRSRQTERVGISGNRREGKRKWQHSSGPSDNQRDVPQSKRHRSSISDPAKRASSARMEEVVDLVSLGDEGSVRNSYEPNFNDWF